MFVVCGANVAQALVRMTKAQIPEVVDVVVKVIENHDDAGKVIISTEILGFGDDRQTAQEVFEEAVNRSEHCILSKSARTKGFVRGSWDAGEEVISIQTVTRQNFMESILGDLVHLLG